MLRKWNVFLMMLLTVPVVAQGQTADSSSGDNPTRLLSRDSLFGINHVFTAEELSRLAVRGVTDVIKLEPGVVSDPGSNDLYIRGGRAEEVAYFVDGVRLAAPPQAPVHALEEVRLISGFIPARYGDVMSGVISVTTKNGGSNFFGSLEGITSEILDPFGYNSLALTLGGPIIPGELDFFVAAEGLWKADHTPFAIETPRLSDEAFSRLEAQPQSIVSYDADFNPGYTPFPAGLADTTDVISLDSIAALTGLNPNEIDGVMHAPRTYDSEMFEMRLAKDAPSSTRAVLANFTVQPSQRLYLRLGGQYGKTYVNEYSLINALYARNRDYVTKERQWRIYGAWRHHFSPSIFYELNASYADGKYVRHPEVFSSNVQDILFYGDVDGVVLDTVHGIPLRNKTPGFEANASARRYWDYVPDREIFLRRYRDGILPGRNDLHNIFAAPGVGFDTYAKGASSSLQLTGRFAARLGIQWLELGFDYRKYTGRWFSVGDVTSLARYFEDGRVEAGSPLFSVSSYEQIRYELARSLELNYVGYDYLGLTEADANTESFFVPGRRSDPPIDYSAFASAPYQPVSYAVYGQDKVELGPATIQLGLRLEVFDNNLLVLRNPYAMMPVVFAGAVPDRPAGINSRSIVYFNRDDKVVGYRSPDGAFFDADGEEADSREILGIGYAALDTSVTYLSIYEEYRPRLLVLPRVEVNYKTPWRTRIFAGYGRLSRNPLRFAYARPWSYVQASRTAEIVGNPDLDPEITNQFELGIRQKIGSRAAFGITGFAMSQDNRVVFERFPHVFPQSYHSYTNNGSASMRGVSIEVEVSPVSNLDVRANYTFQKAASTGLNNDIVQLLAWRHPNPFVPPGDLTVFYDQRHTMNLVLDYRLKRGVGPVVMGIRPFENTDVNIIVRVQSGTPYTQFEEPHPIFAPGVISPVGGINAIRKPWMSMVNLRVDRTFQLGSAAVTAFLWMQNVLDTRNVKGVYPYTGMPDEDGYLSSVLGQNRVEAIREIWGEGFARSFVYHYRARMSSPYHYAFPRRTRLGFRLTF